jgi:hypothetical protein
MPEVEARPAAAAAPVPVAAEQRVPASKGARPHSGRPAARRRSKLAWRASGPRDRKAATVTRCNASRRTSRCTGTARTPTARARCAASPIPPRVRRSRTRSTRSRTSGTPTSARRFTFPSRTATRRPRRKPPSTSTTPIRSGVAAGATTTWVSGSAPRRRPTTGVSRTSSCTACSRRRPRSRIVEAPAAGSSRVTPTGCRTRCGGTIPTTAQTCSRTCRTSITGRRATATATGSSSSF